MNKTRILTIACWAISALALIGLAIWFLTGSIFGIFTGGFNMNFFGINIGGTQNLSGPFDNTYSHNADITNLNAISINWVAGEITILPHDSSEIRITESAQRELRDNEHMHISTDGGTLNIRFRERNNIAGSMPRKNLEVLVPRELSENLTTLSISTTSGSINADSIKATTVTMSSVSATIDLSNITVTNADISTTSGRITATSIIANKLKTSSVSGSVTINEGNIPTIDLSTTSGRTDISGEFERIDISTVSGNSTIKSTTAPTRVDISSVSGDVDLHIPNTGEITVSHSAVSGRFSSEVPVAMQREAAYNFSAVSGNTNIHIFEIAN